MLSILQHEVSESTRLHMGETSSQICNQERLLCLQELTINNSHDAHLPEKAIHNRSSDLLCSIKPNKFKVKQSISSLSERALYEGEEQKISMGCKQDNEILRSMKFF